MSEMALQIAEERKGKLYPTESESQRKGRSDRKVFLNEQCKEIEKNNRMGKTRDLFKKIGAIMGAFHEWGHDKGQKQ